MANKFEGYAWFDVLEERQQKEILFDTEYADRFNHGTDGHTLRIIIADMAEQLVDYADRLKAYGYEF